MKKIAKLSLVAAVAVAGLTTTSSAASLEEAIKGVDISGTATYRYDDRDKDSSNYTKNSYKVAVNLKSKVNEDITFNSRTIIGAGNTEMAEFNTNAADSEAAFALTHANFAYTGLANTTIIAGKQAVPSPFAVSADSAGDEDTGAGLTAVINAGAVTVAATYLNQTNLVTNGADIAGLGLMGNVAGVALDAWYLDVQETSANNNGHQAYTIGAKTKIAPVSLYARYSAVAHDAANTDTESLWKVGAKAKVGIVGFGIDYGQTNKVNNYQTGVNLTGDADATVNLQGWALNLNKNDASLLKLNVNAQVSNTVNLSANYNTLEVGSVDSKEYYGQASYKVNKNFSTYVRLGQHKTDGSDKGTRGRLHVQYSF